MFKQVLSIISKWDFAEKAIFTFLCVTQSYYIYRYIFRFGSEISSPGYSVTPQFLQTAKYFIVLIFILVFLTIIIKNKIFKQQMVLLFKSKTLLILGALFIYLILSVFKYTDFTSFGFTQIVKMIFIIPFVFIIPILVSSKNRESILKYYFIFSIFLHFSFNFIAILLFSLLNSMPGMDFGNYVGRFGGAWDDPNAFSAFLILVFAAFTLFSSKIKNNIFYLIISLLTFYLIFTYSISGLVGFVFASAVLFILKKINLKMVLTILLTIAVASWFLYFSEFYKPIYDDKSGSINQHLEISDTGVSQAKIVNSEGNLLFGTIGEPSFNENFYKQYYDNFGLLGSLLMIVFIASLYKDMIVHFFKAKDKDDFSRSFVLLFLIYIPAFIIINIGIPFFQVFPINLVFWAGVGFVFNVLYVKERDKVVKE